MKTKFKCLDKWENKCRFKYTFRNGDVVYTDLASAEMLKRMRRLDILRVLTEGYEEGTGRGICDKALRAYNKTDSFTGIIRLTASEKDFLGYMLDNDMLNDEDRAVINYYMNYR